MKKWNIGPINLVIALISLLLSFFIGVLIEKFGSPILRDEPLGSFRTILIWPFITSLIILSWLIWFNRKTSILNYIFEIARHPLKGYVWENIKTVYEEVIQKIGSKEGVMMSEKNREVLQKALFQSAKGVYIGVESNLPSTYFAVYPTYLDYNEEYLKKLPAKDKEKVKRIVIARDIGEIHDDVILNPLPYEKFLRWHERNKMKLFWLEKDVISKLQEHFELPSADIGFWEESFVAFFSPQEDGEKVVVRVVNKGDTLFNKARSYVDEMTRTKDDQFLYIKELTSKEVPLFPKEVAEAWEGYVGSYEIRAKNVGEFLIKELEEHQNYKGRILDAAPGVGHEALFLLENGFDLSINEADPMFNERVDERLKSKGYNVEVYQHDWRELSKSLNHFYAAVLILGNDLCMVRGNAEREKCLREFYEILAPGGKLIIDERNFHAIVKKLKDGQHYKRKKIMYMGDSVDCNLELENGGRITRFRFFHVKSGKEVGSVIVETLPKNELLGMLKRVGFGDIKIYADLNLVYDKNKTNRTDFELVYAVDVEFYTYVAVKTT